MSSSDKINENRAENGLPERIANRVRGQWIDRVELIRLTCHEDERGSFTEYYSEGWGNGVIRPVQWSVVRSRGGTLRGMHVHRRHDEYFAVLKGRAWIGLYDMRPDSPTASSSMLVELCDDDPEALLFPRGIIHGWYFRHDALHLQAVSETHESYHPDDNLGCHWSDPALGIAWPDEPRYVSQRAQAFGSLQELLEETQRRDPEFSY